MPRLLSLIAVVFVLLLSPLAPSAASRNPHIHTTLPATFTARVVGVSDGDTITVLIEHEKEKPQIKIRLHGVDAPESKQAFGSRAKQRLSELVFDKDVTVRSTGSDRYNRLL